LKTATENIKKNYLLDTSAFFTFFEDEKGADTVQEILERAKRNETEVFVCFASFAEIFYITFQEEGEKSAYSRINIVNNLPIKRIESNRRIDLIAGKLKAGNKISFADSLIAASAILCDAVLVHKDLEFEQLADQITLLPLPYKRSRI
jgi:predicted nucleic acid-binding protein